MAKRTTLAHIWEKIQKDMEIHPWKHTIFFNLDISGDRFVLTLLSMPKFTLLYFYLAKDTKVAIFANKIFCSKGKQNGK